MSDEKWHGTANGYNGHACRCDRCREAIRLKNQGRTRQQRRLPVEPVMRFTDCEIRHKYFQTLKAGQERGWTIAQADRFCCRVLGLHPWVVYGDEWFADLWQKEGVL